MKILQMNPNDYINYNLNNAKNILITTFNKLEETKGASEHVRRMDVIIRKLERLQHFIE